MTREIGEPCFTRPRVTPLAKRCVNEITVALAGAGVAGMWRMVDWIEDPDNACRGAFLFAHQSEGSQDSEMRRLDAESWQSGKGITMRFECPITAMMVKMRFG
jgi:hypothetical protein